MRRDATKQPGVPSDAWLSWSPPPLQKTVNQAVLLLGAKSSRRCQWGLPGGGGQPPSSLTCPRSPVQTPQVTREDITAASTLNTSCSFANIAAPGAALRYTHRGVGQHVRASGMCTCSVYKHGAASAPGAESVSASLVDCQIILPWIGTCK